MVLRIRHGGPYLITKSTGGLISRKPIVPFKDYTLARSWEFTGGINIRSTLDGDPETWRPRAAGGYDGTHGLSQLSREACLNPFFSPAYAANTPFLMRDGEFIIEAKPLAADSPLREENGGTIPPYWLSGATQVPYGYTSGYACTSRSFYQLYGFFEGRFKMPRGKGMWPAFWLLPNDNSWPPEIDVFEFLGIYPTQYHVGLITDPSQTQGTRQFGDWIETGVDLTESYHEYGCDWGPDNIAFYFDRQMVASYPTPDEFKSKPMYIIVNLSIGGSWGGDPDGTTPWPAHYHCDWVRAWARS